MSKLEKLSIQGIRSFSPDSSEKIEFFTPVTLILGPNGTGKTTIIECLKYATTGELPPGSKVGGSFVHDPKLAQEVEVKAKVGIALKDIAGDHMIVTRSMVATQKAKTIQTRTLDGVIKRLLADGQAKSVSSKCADLDREVVSSLGVSKPVLESVIFCHQEESNWPLSEGKAVKQRFDDIFASTRYVKALEVIRKTKQEQDQNIRVYKNNLTHRREQNAKAQQLSADMEETRMGLAAEEDSLSKLSAKLTPLKEKLTAFRQKYQELCAVQSEMEARRREKELIDDTIARLRANVAEEFVGSDAELRAAIDDVDESVTTVEVKSRDYERQLGALKREVERATADVRRMGIEKGKQEQERQDHEAAKRRWAELIEEFSREEQLAGVTADAGVDEKAAFHRALEQRLTQNEAELARCKRKFEEEEKAIQKDLDKQRAGISKLEQSKDMKRRILAKHEADARRLKARLADAESSVQKLQEVKAELEEAESRLKRLEDQDDTKALKADIEADKGEVKQLEKEMTQLEASIAKMMELSQQLAEKSLLEKERKEKENLIRKSRSKLSDALEQVFCGDVPSHRLRAALDEKLRGLEDENRSSNDHLTTVRSSLTSLRTETQMLGRQLEQKRQQLQQAEEKMRETCGAATYADALSSVQEKKRRAEEERAFVQGSMHTFGKFKERLGKERTCPLCHRGFEAATEVEELVEELEQKLSVAPRELRAKERDVEQVGKRYEALIKLKAVEEEQGLLAGRDIPELERQLASKTERLRSLETEVEEAASLLEVHSADEAVAKSIHGDVVVLERYEAELTAVRSKLERLQREISCGEAGQSLEELQEEKGRKKAAMQALGEAMDRKRERIERAGDALQQERGTVNKLRQESLALEQLHQDKMHFAAELQKAQTEAAALETEVAEEERRFGPLREAILALEKEQGGARLKWERDAEAMRQRTTRLRDCLAQLKQQQAAVSRYLDDGKDVRLQQLLRRIEEADRRIQEKEQAAADIGKALETLKSDAANQKMKRRELTDCQEIREKEANIGRIALRLQELTETVGGINVAELTGNLEHLEREEDQLMRRRQLLIEKKTTLLGQLKHQEKELATPLYKEAEARFKEAVHQLKTTEVAASDLDKYYRALDRAIMSYHSYKMEEINKIVKEVWRNTYRGNDIDYVEIRSDEDDAGISRARRTYNYRVVMVKADTALDMRGRCSAGQKVLASLIIRLALSEAFCLNCGVLALDEPTTNLDRENIESLAFALVEIIKTRSRQKNFQLIVITHDEDFVELLGRSEYVEDFFRISRNSSGLSEIRRLKIEEEFH